MVVEELLIELGFDGGDADKRIHELTKSLGALVAGFGVGALFSKLADEANKAVDASRALGKQLGAIEALMPGESAALAGLSDTIQNLAVQFGKSTAEIGQGFEGAVQSFNDARAATDALELSVKTAASSGAQTSDALRLLSAVTKAYGDTSKEAQRKVADLGQQTVLIGDVQMADLAGSIGRVTPLASTLGVTLEELFAVFAAGTGPLGGAAEVSTQYASILRGLLDRTPKMNKAWKQAFAGSGIKTAQQAIGKYGLQGTLKQLLKQTDGTAEGIQELFGRAEATNLALFLTQKGAATAARASRELAGSAGAVDRAFAAQTQGLGKAAYQADQLAARYKVLQERAGKELEPTFAGASERLYEFSALATQVFVPAADEMLAMFGPLVSDTNDWRQSLELLRDVLLTLAAGFDVILTGMAKLMSGVTYVAATVANITGNLANLGFGALTDPNAADKLLRGQSEIGRAFDAENQRINAGIQGRMALRRQAYGADSTRAFMTPPPRQSNGLEDIRNDASNIAGAIRGFLSSRPGQGGVLGQVNVGKVEISVTVPAGTEAAAASRIADVGQRVFWQQVLQQANAALAPQLQPSGG